MSQAEELLDSLDETIPTHQHDVIDSDSYFIIDPITRAVENTSGSKNLLMQYDHASERYTFELPRYVEGHDMSLCTAVKVHYNNIESGTLIENADVNDLDDLHVDPTDANKVICSWLIKRQATQLVGSLNFLVQYLCATSDGTITYEWHSDIYKNIEIREGRNNGPAAVSDYTDILEQWRAKLFGVEDSITASILALLEDFSADVLKKDNTEEYTPTENYHPSTKKYVDDNISKLSEEMEELTKELENRDSSQNANQGGADYTFLKGLIYYAFGDSIVDMQGTLTSPETFGDTGYTSDLQSRNITGITVEGYVTAIERRYGLVATNYGKSGHTLVADYATLATLSYSDVALVTIAYGVNDARTGVPLGTVNSTDITTFAGALNMLLRKIYTDNPECRVVVLTPIQRLYVSEFGIGTPNANGNYLVDFVDMCKKVAAKRSTKCIDMYRDCGINQTNLYYYTVEGVHPVNQGFTRMCGAVIPVLDEMFAVEFEPFGTMTNTGETEPDEPDTGGSGSEDNPPEEEIGATEVDISSRLTKDGYYYDGYASVMGRGSYSGIELPLIELIEGKTYTLVTYINGNTDSRYAAVSIDENASNGTYLSYSSTDTDGNWVFTLVADGVYKASITWVAGEQKRTVSGVQTPCLYLSFGCLKGYEEQTKLSYV